MSTYRYFLNPFLADRITFIILLEIADYLKVALENEPDNAQIAAIMAKLQPILTSYHSKYLAYSGKKDLSLGNTQAFYDLFETLPKKLRKWERDILRIIDEDSPEFKAILPKGRSEVYRGKLSEVQLNLENFLAKLRLNDKLGELVDEVTAFVNQFIALQNTKHAGYAGNDDSTIELYAAFKALAICMYSIMGSLISIYAEDPTRCEHYFPMEYLRTKSSGNDNEPENLLVPLGSTAVSKTAVKPGMKLSL